MEAPQYVKQMPTDIKGEIDNKTVIVEDIKMTHVSMDRLFRQKIDKETQTLNEILGQIDLIDIYRTFCPKAGKCTFFFQVHMKHSPGEILSSVTKQTLLDLRKLKSYQASFLTTL